MRHPARFAGYWREPAKELLFPPIECWSDVSRSGLQLTTGPNTGLAVFTASVMFGRTQRPPEPCSTEIVSATIGAASYSASVTVPTLTLTIPPATVGEVLRAAHEITIDSADALTGRLYARRWLRNTRASMVAPPAIAVPANVSSFPLIQTRAPVPSVVVRGHRDPGLRSFTLTTSPAF